MKKNIKDIAIVIVVLIFGKGFKGKKVRLAMQLPVLRVRLLQWQT